MKTKNEIKELREKVNSALATLSEETGVQFSIANISYDDTMITTKLTGVFGASKEDAERTLFEKGAVAVGLKLSDYGRTFKRNGTTYKIVGVKLRCSSRPIVVERDGSRFRVSMDVIKEYLNNE
jgi:hypothetical protein